MTPLVPIFSTQRMSKMIYMINFKLPTASTLLKSDTLSLWDLVEDLKMVTRKRQFYYMRSGALAAETMKFTVT